MALTKPKAGMEGTGSTSPSWLNCRLKSTAGSVQSAGFPRGPSLYYVSKGTGWVGSEKWQFLLTFSTINSDIG